MDKDRIKYDYYNEPRKYGTKGFSYVTKEIRHKIEELLKKKKTVKEVCLELGVSRGTLYHERMRMGSVDVPYDAETAHQNYLYRTLVNHNRHRKELPRSHTQAISRMYRLIKGVMKEAMSHNTKDVLENCLILLEKMGADPNKMKRPLTEEEKATIIGLRKEGKTYAEIEKITKRSRSCVHHLIESMKDELNQSTEDIFYDKLSKKWLDK